MNELRALVAEDEPLLAQALLADLHAVWPELATSHAADGPSALQQALAERPQVCFLDIRMPGLSGLEVAQALAEDWPEAVAFPLLVFVTAYDQHALQAFELQAVDYLVKPLGRERLKACVARLRQRLAERAAPGAAPPGQALAAALQQLRGLLGSGAGAAGPAAAAKLEVIQAQSGSLVHLIPIDEVLYFEAADKYVRVVTAAGGTAGSGEHLIRISLRELLPQLDERRFWQVHRGTVVQARAITTARREESGKVTLTLRGRPEKLTASRLYAHLFKGL